MDLLGMLKKYQQAYLILLFYFVLMVVGATVGHQFDKKDGFTYGYLAGIVVSVVLWFQYGKKMSKL